MLPTIAQGEMLLDMVWILRAVFTFILVAILWATIRAGMNANLFDVLGTLLKDPWVVATLVDAYGGFITFYVWVAYKEHSLLARVIWLVLILCLGNIAMASYMLWQLSKMSAGDPVSKLLLRSSR